MQKFFILVVVSIVIAFAVKSLMITDSLYHNSLAEQLSAEQIDSLISLSNQWAWLGYLLVPVFYLLKCSVIALCIGLAIFLISDKFEYEKVFDAVVTAEFVFIIPALLKLFWFLFFDTDFTIADLQNFHPLSILNLVENENLTAWQRYPLQIMNLFEVLYWFVLGYGLSIELPQFKLPKAMGIVASSYGLGLVIWMVAVMFLTLSAS